MRFGLYVNPQTPGPDADGRIIREVIGQIELAERLGLTDVWLTEHHFTGYNAYSDPVTLAAAIAKATKTMTIGYSLAVVPFHHPIRFVTACNLIDQISEGRLIVGVGPGNSPDEFVGYGLDENERHAMTNEFVETCLTAWNAPPEGFSYSGKFWRGNVNGRIIPTPYQKPRPSIAWATTTPKTMEWTGRQGYSWLIAPFAPEWVASRLKLYQAGLDAGNHDAATLERAWYGTGMNKQIYVAKPGENWEETIGQYIDNYVRESARANFGIDNLTKTDFEARRERMLRTWMCIGTADEIVERLTPFVEIGVQHCMVWTTFGYIADHLVRESLERLASDVIPRLREVKYDPAKREYYAERAIEMGVAPVVA